MYLHPMVVHFPIVLLLLSSGLGLLYLFVWPRAELRWATWWAMGLGWLATAAAVITGLITQAGLPPQADYRAVLNLHIGAGLSLLVVYAAPLYLEWLRSGARSRGRHTTGAQGAQLGLLDDPTRRWLAAALLIVGALLVVITGFYGGELVYVWGVNVK